MCAAAVDGPVARRYLLKRRLGKGAYGIVWKAVDRRTGEVVAIKKIFDAFKDKTDAQRTFREVMLLQEFEDHPNIIRLLDVIRAENDKDIYLVFEFMDTDLDAVIRKGRLLEDVHKRYIFYQLLRATSFIHSGRVIHRDQKVHPRGGHVESRLHSGRDAAGEASVPRHVHSAPAGAGSGLRPASLRGGPPGSWLKLQRLHSAPPGDQAVVARRGRSGAGTPTGPGGGRGRAQSPGHGPRSSPGGDAARGAPGGAPNVLGQDSAPRLRPPPPGGPAREGRAPGAAPPWDEPREGAAAAAPSLASQAAAQVAVRALIRSDRAPGPRVGAAGARQVAAPPSPRPRPGRRMFSASASQGARAAARAALGGYSQAYGTVCRSALGRLPLPPGPRAPPPADVPPGPRALHAPPPLDGPH